MRPDPDPNPSDSATRLAEVFGQVGAGPDGLSSSEAKSRLARYGPNAIVETRRSPWLEFLGYFWGPIPWMIEIADLLSMAVGHWADVGIITALLVFNAAVGFWQEHKAGSAIEALRSKLALRARVRRDGRWQEVDATRIVPGDVIRVRLGDVVPADVVLFGDGYLSVDQSALTGESMPVAKGPGDEAFSGSMVKQGEMAGVVTATGARTFFGRTARLVSEAGKPSHFQRAVLEIGDYLIYLCVVLVTVLVLVQLARGEHWLTLLQFALILAVASVPVAMPAVLSVTLAVGALKLSKLKAIVSRLEAIEEMAGMDVLCSDKTGTLTENRLTVGEPAPLGASGPGELLRWAALASREEDADPIDTAVIQAAGGADAVKGYERRSFVPFDPVGKRTEARVGTPDGTTVAVTKGAPQVVLALCEPDPDLEARAREAIDRFAADGYRTLGVAVAGEDGAWRFEGLVPLFDPPRPDAADTIRDAVRHGIRVKMITGDNLAIARQTARQLGLGSDVRPAGATGDPGAVEAAEGFAEVFPEHKFAIVQALQDRGHIVGMTGDGVNDAPALKQADVGVAVAGATDAARASADLVLTAPGLSVILRAVEEARRIFERMNSYAVYRITETIRIMFFVVLAMVFFDFYPINAIMIILLAFLNDIPIMTIAYDNTRLDPKPVRWDMRRVITVATAMGAVGVAGSFGMLLLARDWLHLSVPQIQTYVFLKMAVAGHLVLFVARTRGHFWEKPYPAPAMVWSAVVTKALATLVAAYGFGLVTPISWPDIGLIWGYSAVSAVVTDAVKVWVLRHRDLSSPRHSRFLAVVRRAVTPHAAWPRSGA